MNFFSEDEKYFVRRKQALLKAFVKLMSKRCWIRKIFYNNEEKNVSGPRELPSYILTSQLR